MLLQIITAISDFLWGTPMTVALVGTGLYLGIRFGFRYNFRKVGFNFRNTFGKMFQKGEGTGTVSGFAAACTAMAAMGVAGEIAEARRLEHGTGNATFRNDLIDAIFNLTEEQLEKGVRYEIYQG